MAYHDSRVHTDELDELMTQYDSLDPEAFTESSYEAATEVYLEAYEIMSDDNVGEHYSQKQINAVAKGLKAALKALQPMFKVKSTSVFINGFDSLTEEDIETINDGGISIDPAALTDEFVPEGNAKQSILVIGGAFDGPPYYGWSLFTTSVLNDDDEVEAVGNVFGADNLDESAGLRFWIKYGEDYVPAPKYMIIGVGSSSEGVYFECEPDAVQLPESEGYVGVAWNLFYDTEGDEEIFDYLDSLDYITISIEDCYQKEFYLSDLHAFEWSINSADFTAMDQQIIDAQNYLATLNKDDWSVRSWQRVEQSIEAARALHETYAVTQQEVDKAAEFIVRCLNWLTLRGETPTQEEIDALEAAYYNALTYWRGNYTGRSYVTLKAEIDEVGEYINDELSSAACIDLTNRLNAAVAGLVPITHGGTVAPTPATDYNGKAVNVKLFSLEDFSGNREFNKAQGHRRDNVGYDLVTSSTSVDLPAQALKMTAQADLSSKHTDQHGAMQFKLADKICDPIHPDVTTEDGNEIGGSIGDLKGSAGIRIWVGVNDYNLAKNAYFRFGVSNCQEGPLFEKHAVNIPFPAAGSGWLYIPWECFDYYDEWTHGVDINLTEIRFIIIRVDGEVPKGLEVYATCVSAYTDPANSENAAPVISGVTEGQTVDVAGGSVAPKWDVGSATLNGKRYLAGAPIDKNDDYTLVVTNGDKQTTVNFTVTGGITADSIPVVVGVAEGGEYDEPVTINWDVGEATLNGEPVEKGVVVSEPGNYMLQVINGSKSVAIRFSIAAVAVEYEQPVIEGAENGGEYDAAVTLTWNVGEATLNGEPAENGVIVSEPGEYTLRVVNGDKEAVIAFTIKESKPPVKKGDANGDGKISVDDALTALRVAARLAEPTEELLATCDIDGNGKIEVSDALAILRVAAKLAKEESLQ
ncbi:MAG: dockerin type I repeat-containing protein, partial [Clostridia bacterium]|nr:dockerin type I repeat-containing protein [Clostridia bacterium]